MAGIADIAGDFTARAADGCVSAVHAVTAAVASVPAWELAGGLLAAAGLAGLVGGQAWALSQSLQTKRMVRRLAAKVAAPYLASLSLHSGVAREIITVDANNSIIRYNHYPRKRGDAACQTEPFASVLGIGIQSKYGKPITIVSTCYYKPEMPPTLPKDIRVNWLRVLACIAANTPCQIVFCDERSVQHITWAGGYRHFGGRAWLAVELFQAIRFVRDACEAYAKLCDRARAREIEDAKPYIPRVYRCAPRDGDEPSPILTNPDDMCVDDWGFMEKDDGEQEAVRPRPAWLLKPLPPLNPNYVDSDEDRADGFG
jgi:hypothetical protein